MPLATPPRDGISDGAWLFVRALLWLGIALALGAVAFVITPTGRAWVTHVARLGSAVAQIGLMNRGPGLRELREIGCTRPAVIEADGLRTLAQVSGRETAADLAPFGAPPHSRVVLCAARAGATSPSCREIARTYAEASHTAERLWVVRNGGIITCKGSYDPRTGAYRDAKAPEEDVD